MELWSVSLSLEAQGDFKHYYYYYYTDRVYNPTSSLEHF